MGWPQEDNYQILRIKLRSSKEYENFLEEVKNGKVKPLSEIQLEDNDIIKFEDEKWTKHKK